MYIILALIILILLFCFINPKSNISLCVIKLLHIIFILFVVFFPFIIKDKRLLFCYVIIMCGVFVHWYLLNDMCFLTLMEKQITGRIENKDTFIGEIVGGIYNVKGYEIKIISVILVLYAIHKIVK